MYEEISIKRPPLGRIYPDWIDDKKGPIAMTPTPSDG